MRVALPVGRRRKGGKEEAATAAVWNSHLLGANALFKFKCTTLSEWLSDSQSQHSVSNPLWQQFSQSLRAATALFQIELSVFSTLITCITKMVVEGAIKLDLTPFLAVFDRKLMPQFDTEIEMSLGWSDADMQLAGCQKQLRLKERGKRRRRFKGKVRAHTRRQTPKGERMAVLNG